MPYRRRHEGLTPIQRYEEKKIWQLIVTLLSVCMIFSYSLLRAGLIAIICSLICYAKELRQTVWDALDPINKINKNRGFESFSKEDCWRHLRFKKDDLLPLKQNLLFPDYIILDNGVTCSGQYAMCYGDFTILQH